MISPMQFFDRIFCNTGQQIIFANLVIQKLIATYMAIARSSKFIVL